MRPEASRSDHRWSRWMLTLIVSATLVRIAAAGLVELGNDEVYYWTYAAFPAWSHFDHPPMVGWLIQATTLDLLLEDELFVRLGAVLCAGVATWLMYTIGNRLAGPRAGLIAALLHTSTVYGSILAGIVILPDAPLVVFWLASLALLLRALPARSIGQVERLLVLAAGVTIGLAMLSKYHGVFLGIGALAYVALYDRRWLREPAVYGAALLAGVAASPVLIWNLQNDFISFTYHGGRAAPNLELRPDLFLSELGGQIGYQNPITWVLIVMALWAVARGRSVVDGPQVRLLFLTALPLWGAFTAVSLFRGTLPHWTGPAYLSLILITAAQAVLVGQEGAIPRRFLAPLVLLLPVLAATVLTIRFAPASFGRDDPETLRGEGDPTMDMFGWHQIRRGVERVLASDVEAGTLSADAPVLSFRWFPAAHLDYYVARPLGRPLLAAGNLDRVHKYFWINQERGGLVPGEDAVHVAVSNWYEDPDELFGGLFDGIEPPDTIRVFRSGVHVRNAFVYRLRAYTGAPLVPDVEGGQPR